MKSVSQPKAVMICCSVLQTEVESLCKAHWPGHRLRFLPSMMHMHPERLGSSLESILDSELKKGHVVVLIYGDCCARMTALEALPGVARTRGKNCCELLLGPEEYRRLLHEGAFFCSPNGPVAGRKFLRKNLALTATMPPA